MLSTVSKSVMLTLLGVFLFASQACAEAQTPSPESILEATGVKGGFIVHLGSGDGKLTAALRVNERYQVHGLSRDPSAVQTARKNVRAKGIYGEVSIDQLQGNRLP